ncbi:MAG: helix-turn-helix transcriptional regulator [FCB group bacterium]|nr:helix-turn-helix transcriptional regulator [FCB group bacterium]
MARKIKPWQKELLLNARKDKKLTQLELSTESRISLRTIQDLENYRRSSYSDSILITLCRTLEVDYHEFLGESKDNQNVRGAVKYNWLYLTGITVGILAIVFLVSKFIESERRVDWIMDAQLQVHPFPPEWGGSEGVAVNYYELNRVLQPGQSDTVEIKWSYHFNSGPPLSTPMYFISAYTEWEPDTEIRVFDGILQGDGFEINHFEITAPRTPGVYKVRIFFTSSFAPISSYYGHPPHNQVTSPASAPYIEFPIEVIK